MSAPPCQDTIASSFLEHAGFQIGLTERSTQSGRTVLANGPATRVDDPAFLTTLWSKVSEEPWAPGMRDLFYEMAPTRMRDRRLSTARQPPAATSTIRIGSQESSAVHPLRRRTRNDAFWTKDTSWTRRPSVNGQSGRSVLVDWCRSA